MFFASVLLACGVTITLPNKELKTGPTQTEFIKIPIPSTDKVFLTLEFGAGNLNIRPGAQQLLIDGVATYNVPDLSPEIEQEIRRIKIRTGRLEVEGIPEFDENIINNWDLKIATFPMNLEINAGAYNGDFDFGGMAISNLKIRDGASDVNLTFNLPNLLVMDSFDYSTGASQVKLTKLSNANFTNMMLKSGAGNYYLDFSGELKQEARVKITSGISRIQIVVPEYMTAKVIYSGKLTNISYSGNWIKDGSNYVINGVTPLLLIEVEMSAGDLELKN